ncbi:MAG: cyclophilin-like fold protein [Candidatus Heimdallarchaeota archaeon]
MKKIKIITQSGEFFANLSEDCPVTTKAIWEALPIEAKVQTWGDEIYFSIPVDVAEENAKEVVNLGDLGYWPPGAAFCIFFGKTPASKGDEIRPASRVNVFGALKKINSEIIAKLRQVSSRDTIRVEKVPEK